MWRRERTGVADIGAWLPAHLIGGAILHVTDAVLYGLAALGLAAGIALFASGHAGRAEGYLAGDDSPVVDPLPAVALVKARPGAVPMHRHRRGPGPDGHRAAD